MLEEIFGKQAVQHSYDLSTPLLPAYYLLSVLLHISVSVSVSTACPSRAAPGRLLASCLLLSGKHSGCDVGQGLAAHQGMLV